MRRPVAWLLAVVLFAEGFGVAAVNWFLGVVVERQNMSLAGLDPDAMALSSKIGGVVFGLYFLLCAYVALLVALRDRAPAGFGRLTLISAAVVHGLLAALTWSLIGPGAFGCLAVVLALLVLLLMTYDRPDAQPEPGANPPAGPAPGHRAPGGEGPDREGPGHTAPGTPAPGTPAPGAPAPRKDAPPAPPANGDVPPHSAGAVSGPVPAGRRDRRGAPGLAGC